MVGDNTVYLFRHASIVGTQPSFDVRDRKIQLCRSQGPSKGRVGIAIHQHPIRPFLKQDFLDPDELLSRHRAMRLPTNSELIIGSRNTHLIEKYLRHIGIVVLTRMDQHFSYACARKRAIRPRWFPGLSIESGGYVLCTIHRAENTDDQVRLKKIIHGLGSCLMPVILPLHPRTNAKLASAGLRLPANVHAVDPVGYLEMAWLESNCCVIATDSGGVQKEAFFNGKPCVTLRDETEWVELVDIGANVLVGADSSAICEGIERMVGRVFPQLPVYGDGSASIKIAAALG